MKEKIEKNRNFYFKNIKGFQTNPKIKRIRKKNWIYNQFQLKDTIKTNQNLYNRNKDETKQLKDQGLKWKHHKQMGMSCNLACRREKGGCSTDHRHVTDHRVNSLATPRGKGQRGASEETLEGHFVPPWDSARAARSGCANK